MEELYGDGLEDGGLHETRGQTRAGRGGDTQPPSSERLIQMSVARMWL